MSETGSLPSPLDDDVPQDPTDEAVDGSQDPPSPDDPPPDDPDLPADDSGFRPHRTPETIVAGALDITVGYGGMCLKFVRTAAEIGPKFASAKKAWAGAKHKHDGFADAPAGAFLFMSHPKSVFGHVAVYLGDGEMRTTNSATNRIHTDPISKWDRWGYTVLGWSEDLNGVHVPELAPVQPEPVPSTSTTTTHGSVVLEKRSRGPRVAALQRGLNRVFPAYSRLDVDESYGPETAKVVAEFQRRSGLPSTGTVDTATQAALASHGIRF